MLEALQSTGVIALRHDTEDRNGIVYRWAVVEPTDEGRQHLASETDAEWSFKSCEIVEGEVTGIQMLQDQRVAHVHYILDTVNRTPFASSECADQSASMTTTMSPFDDGWRVQ